MPVGGQLHNNSIVVSDDDHCGGSSSEDAALVLLSSADEADVADVLGEQYVQISSDDGDGEGYDQHNRATPTLSSPGKARKRRRSLPHQQSAMAASPVRSPKKTMRKRSMSIFTENVNVDDDEDLSSDEEPTGTNQLNADWTVDEKRALVHAIEAQLPANDSITYSRRLKSIKWQSVNLPGRSEQDCKVMLMQILKKIRHLRTLGELLGDVHVALTNPRPTYSKNAYNLFCAEYRAQRPDRKIAVTELGQLFRQLPLVERQRFDEQAAAANSKELPQRKRAALLRELEGQPKTPFNLYCRAELETGRFEKQKMRTDFARLNDEEKLPFVKQAMSMAQEAGRDSFEVLSTKEIRMIRQSVKPPSAYNLFVKEYFANAVGNVTMMDVSRAYKELQPDSKKELQERASKMKDNAAPTAIKSKKTPDAESATVEEPRVKKAKKTKTTTENEFTQPKLETTLTPVKSKRSDAVDGDSGRKRKSNGDSTVDHALSSPMANSTRFTSIKMESSSETESVVNKRRKSIKSEKSRIAEPERVPTSIFNYYVERVYDGNPKKSKKAFDKLEPADRKSLKREFKKCMHEYMDRLEQYLSSLSKVEMVEYANRSRQQAIEEPDETSHRNSVSSASDD